MISYVARVAADARWAWLAQNRLLKQSLSERWLWLLGGADLIFRLRAIGDSQLAVVNARSGERQG